MTKPAVTLRNTKGSALDYTELDTNFTNLRDATFGVTDGTNSHDFDLNSRITFTAGSNITLAVNPSTGAITISGSSSGTIQPGLNGYLPVYLGDGTTLNDTVISYSSSNGVGINLTANSGPDFHINNHLIADSFSTGVASVSRLDCSVAAGYPMINSSTANSYANNATVDFADFSGMIMANRQDSSGNVSLWIVGSTGVVNIANSTGTANTGTIAYNSGINGYRWTNNTGGTITVSFAAIKTRNGA